MDIAYDVVYKGGYQQVHTCDRGYVVIRHELGKWTVRAQYAGGGHTEDTVSTLDAVDALEAEYIDRLGGLA